MPFTLAHPAIVLPFLKINTRYISATGLIVGSVAPDLEYFIRMSVRGPYTRSQLNFFMIDIPVALISALLLHLVVKNNLIDNLPRFFQCRLVELRRFDFISNLKEHPWAFVLSFGLGVASHWLWDSFTHPGSFFVQHLPFYDEVIPYEGVKYPMYYALQNVSTYAGMLAIILYVLLQKPDPAVKFTQPIPGYWVMVATTSIIFVIVRFNIANEARTYGNLAVTTVSAICCSLLVAGVLPFKRWST